MRPPRLDDVRVVVRLFASFREAVGASRVELELPTGATAADAARTVLRDHPLAAERALLARNREYVDPAATLAEGDELALIPPVSGGMAGARGRVAVSDAPLSIDEAVGHVRDEEVGGVVIFVGTVRRSSRGARVTRLDYEAYAEMAERVMTELADRLAREHGARLAIHHRTGTLAVGDLAVVVVAGAPHRAEAFAAARAAIDELKHTAPIWKKEYADDGAVWVDEHP